MPEDKCGICLKTGGYKGLLTDEIVEIGKPLLIECINERAVDFETVRYEYKFVDQIELACCQECLKAEKAIFVTPRRRVAKEKLHAYCERLRVNMTYEQYKKKIINPLACVFFLFAFLTFFFSLMTVFDVILFFLFGLCPLFFGIVLLLYSPKTHAKRTARVAPMVERKRKELDKKVELEWIVDMKYIIGSQILAKRGGQGSELIVMWQGYCQRLSDTMLYGMPEEYQVTGRRFFLTPSQWSNIEKSPFS